MGMIMSCNNFNPKLNSNELNPTRKFANNSFKIAVSGARIRSSTIWRLGKDVGSHFNSVANDRGRSEVIPAKIERKEENFEKSTEISSSRFNLRVFNIRDLESKVHVFIKL
ncbi:hypothetical protein AVEN_256073-1 [Araneus ventricosus]|uniref:Uncharacterized protein n=1 Tax=Araneus ventricosus TaxID=182803 RepID=A0A4Y2SNV7_ARAVE|nr:hypothetical protein AVEN_256073-1 [Araneus ventricosus]